MKDWEKFIGAICLLLAYAGGKYDLYYLVIISLGLLLFGISYLNQLRRKIK